MSWYCRTNSTQRSIEGSMLHIEGMSRILSTNITTHMLLNELKLRQLSTEACARTPTTPSLLISPGYPEPSDPEVAVGVEEFTTNNALTKTSLSQARAMKMRLTG